MNYDDWKTEAPEDYEERMGVRRHGDGPEFQISGLCACGIETNRALSDRNGYRWQCPKCAEIYVRSIYDRASRKVG